MKGKFAGAMIILFFLISLTIYLVKPDETTLKILGNAAQTIAGLLAAVYLFRTASAFSREDSVRPYWLWLAAGYVLNALGFITYALWETVLGLEVPTPSLADLFWGLSYPALIYGSLAMLRTYVNSGLAVRINPLSWVGTLVVFLAAGYFLMLPTLQDTEAGLLEKFVLLLYPVGDVFLFAASTAIALMMRQFGSGKLGAPWTFIALGMITVTLGDMVYTYLSAQDLYETGNLVDLSWVLQGCLVAWGGILQYRLVKEGPAANSAA
ncbi:MAG TPA: hypothetical protein VD902_06090 [Symbiobacteriaceae bacterium]|nr:hypothetical protein [Symbiobacteriaceae bacterium]